MQHVDTHTEDSRYYCRWVAINGSSMSAAAICADIKGTEINGVLMALQMLDGTRVSRTRHLTLASSHNDHTLTISRSYMWSFCPYTPFSHSLVDMRPVIAALRGAPVVLLLGQLIVQRVDSNGHLMFCSHFTGQSNQSVNGSVSWLWKASSNTSYQSWLTDMLHFLFTIIIMTHALFSGKPGLQYISVLQYS